MTTISKSNAYKIFDHFITNAKKKYPDLNYQIKDLKIIEDNVNSIFNESVTILKEDSDGSETDDFIYNAIYLEFKSELNSKWRMNYVTRQSLEFKVFTAINFLKEHFRANEIEALKLASLFEKISSESTNLENFDTQIRLKSPSHLAFEDFEINDSYGNPILSALENTAYHYLVYLSGQEKEIYLENIEEYLPQKEVVEFFKSKIANPPKKKLEI